MIAHRGCADQYPENTIFAVERSAPHVDMVEVDVQRCGSGEIVVFHDDELESLTDGTGSVRTTDWRTLRDLDVLDSGEPIPLLTDLLAAVPPDTGVNVELKHDGMASDVLSIAGEVENEVLFSSFDGDALRELRTADDDASTGYVFSDSPDISRSIAADIGCETIHPSADLVRSSELVSNAHAGGFEVNAWTVATRELATALVDAGVDGLFVDRWDIFE